MRAIDDSIKDYARLRALMNPYIVSVTNMELLLRNLATYDFCKKIYVFDVAFSDASKLFLRDLFSQSKDKVFLLEGDMKSILEEKPETIDPKKYGAVGIQKVKELVKNRMMMCGCQNQA